MAEQKKTTPSPSTPISGSKQTTGAVCAECKDVFTHNDDQVIYADNALYHRECFTCNGCYLQFPECGYSYFVEQRDPRRTDRFCMSCYEERKCAACSKRFFDEYIESLHKLWHVDCFRCEECKKPINETTQKYVISNEKVYCDNSKCCKDEEEDSSWSPSSQ